MKINKCIICGENPLSCVYIGKKEVCLYCRDKAFIKEYKKLQKKFGVYIDPKFIEENITIYEKYKNKKIIKNIN